MFPFCFEWVWDVGHYLFFGAMWYAVIIISLGMTYCVGKSLVDTLNGKGAGHGDGHH
ncbi:MAG: hypothetical protein HQK66_08185 [Desulfamplus sp.]|nr:hypothetical protein [Desulfamplus sp.]